MPASVLEQQYFLCCLVLQHRYNKNGVSVTSKSLHLQFSLPFVDCNDSLPFVDCNDTSYMPCGLNPWNRCWTGARLSAKGLQGPVRCLYCDQLPETIDHLMVQCPHVRVIWFRILTELGFGQYTPDQNSQFRSWWCQLSRCQPKQQRKSLTTTAIACCRILWLERNGRHFEGKFETKDRICNRIREELQMWRLATQTAERCEE